MATTRARAVFLVFFCGLLMYSCNLSLYLRYDAGLSYNLGKNWQPKPTANPRPSSIDSAQAGKLPEDDGIDHGVSVYEVDGLTKHLVIARMADEEEKASWVKYLPEDLNIVPKSYVVDLKPEDAQPGALAVPMNKGHEAQVYLTYIIEHYDSLPDLAIFIHAHETSWHNNNLQLHSMLVMLLELNYRRVFMQGYMNLRCHWSPGCPDWIKVNVTIQDDSKKEEFVMRQALLDLFPTEMAQYGVPDTISVACCAQFAVSRKRLLGHPRERYVEWREWVINTDLPDDISGRVWEYLWHFIFSSQDANVSLDDRVRYCPLQHVCYCDGYGYCFGDAGRYDRYQQKRDEADKLTRDLNAMEEGRVEVEGEGENARREKIEEMKKKAKQAQKEYWALEVLAKKRGSDAKLRRAEVGDNEFSG